MKNQIHWAVMIGSMSGSAWLEAGHAAGLMVLAMCVGVKMIVGHLRD